ncbi:MAG: heat-inducible transcriptional repressor HrcA [Thermoleophilia bacterium]|nr:heat-inducible transcriptional repressor HrcA [Thermoleophilia bacterium]
MSTPEPRIPAPGGPPTLRERQEAILREVVERHIATGAPVGSKHIAGQGGLDWASSTIRSELNRLEELGYLSHPHTSAGRVPTDRGYRYYVDTLLPRRSLPSPPAGIAGALDEGRMRQEVDLAMRTLADVMAQVTDLLGVVTGPPPTSATIRHVEVLRLQPQLVCVVVITSSGDVARRVFAFDTAVDHGLVEWAAAFMNECAVGLPVGSRTLARRLEDPSLGPRERAFMADVAPALTDLREEAALYVGGQARFLAARVTDLREIDALMRALEERYALLALLRGALEANRVVLRIGEELTPSGLSGLSLVAANYGSARRNLGTVSVIGPTRMDYALAIATVREAAQALSGYVEEVYE